MKSLDVTLADGRLILDRRKSPPWARLALWGALMAGAAALFLYPGHPAHGHEFTDVQVGAITSAIAGLFFLPWLLKEMRPQTFVLDRPRDLILLNGRLLYPLSEIASVHLDRAFWTAQGGEQSTLVLWLQTHQKVEIEILRRSEGGAREEMQGIAEAIAGYTGLNLILPEGFVAGESADEALPLGVSRRFGGKRRQTTRKTARHTSLRGRAVRLR